MGSPTRPGAAAAPDHPRDPGPPPALPRGRPLRPARRAGPPRLPGGAHRARRWPRCASRWGPAVALALFRVRPGTFRPVRRGLLVTRGVLGGLAALLYFYALSLIPAGQATLLNNTFPVIAVAISYFTLGERPTWHLLLALGVTSLGVYPGPRGRAGSASPWAGGSGWASPRRSWARGRSPPSGRCGPPTTRATIFFAFTLGGLLVSAPLVLGTWSLHRHAWIFAMAAGRGLLRRADLHDRGLRRAHRGRGRGLAAAHPGGELPVGRGGAGREPVGDRRGRGGARDRRGGLRIGAGAQASRAGGGSDAAPRTAHARGRWPASQLVGCGDLLRPHGGAGAPARHRAGPVHAGSALGGALRRGGGGQPGGLRGAPVPVPAAQRPAARHPGPLGRPGGGPLLRRPGAHPGRRGRDDLQPLPGHRDASWRSAAAPGAPRPAALAGHRDRHAGRRCSCSGTARCSLGLGWGEGAALAGGGLRGGERQRHPGHARHRQRAHHLLLLLPGRPARWCCPSRSTPGPAGSCPGRWRWLMALSRLRGPGAHDRGLRRALGGGGGVLAAAHPHRAGTCSRPLLLGEPLTAVGVVGIAVSVAGVAWATRLGQRAAVVPPP